MRRELKYIFTSRSHDPARWVLGNIPSLQTEHRPRQVSSLYFDSLNYACYQESNSGASERTKLRLRWYGEYGDDTTGTLEFKRRLNHQGWKKQIGLGALRFADSRYSELRHAIAERLGHEDRALFFMFNHPTLIVTYHRHYFVTRDRRIRVTVDTSLRFFDQRLRLKPNLIFDSVKAGFEVLECKFAADLNPSEARILEPLGLRWTRFSKYCYGLGALSGE